MVLYLETFQASKKRACANIKVWVGIFCKRNNINVMKNMNFSNIKSEIICTSNRAMCLPSYCWLFSMSMLLLLLIKGLLSLGFPSPVNTHKDSVMSLQHHQVFSVFSLLISKRPQAEYFQPIHPILQHSA